MAVIRPDAPEPAKPVETAQPLAVSELMRRLDEKARETDKLKKKLIEAEERLETALRKIPKPGGPLGDEPDLADDKAMAIEALRAKAIEHDRKGDLLDAFYLYRRIIRLDPQDVPALYQLATIYYSARLPAKATLVLRLILEIDPAQDRAREALGEIEREMRG